MAATLLASRELESTSSKQQLRYSETKLNCLPSSQEPKGHLSSRTQAMELGLEVRGSAQLQSQNLKKLSSD